MSSGSHNFERLKAHIVPLSVADSFEMARLEWELIGMEVSEEFDHCPCGQQIKEHCYIENRENKNRTYVGNVCINKFLGIRTGNLFDGLRRIREDITANPNEDLIRHAYQFGYIYEKEFGFLMQTRFKRQLSVKQLEWKKKINRRILNQVVVAKRSTCPCLQPDAGKLPGRQSRACFVAAPVKANVSCWNGYF